MLSLFLYCVHLIQEYIACQEGSKAEEFSTILVIPERRVLVEFDSFICILAGIKNLTESKDRLS